MPLEEHLLRSGNWLFRRRGYAPFALVLPLMALAACQFDWPWHRHDLQELWEYGCMFIAAAGLLLRAATVGYAPRGTSGRNTHRQVAEQLTTTGAYSVVRHPLYLANFLIMLGIVLFWHSVWLVLVLGLAYWLYYERIIFAEEAFLKQKYGEAFAAWARRTPAFVPRLNHWEKPALPFSMRSVLRREYSTFLLVTSCFMGIEILEHLVVEHRVVIEPFYAWLGLSGVAAFLLLRTVKHHSAWLDVQGR